MGRLILHTILTVITGGFWLVVLLIKFLLDNSGSSRRRTRNIHVRLR